jgi:hypothetical protein
MKMSTYVWGIIVFLIGLLVLFVGIGLYFANGDDFVTFCIGRQTYDRWLAEQIAIRRIC